MARVAPPGVIADETQRAVALDVVQPLHRGQLRDCVPEAVGDQHRSQPHAVPAQGGQFVVHDVVRRQEVRADQEQRQPAPENGPLDLGVPGVAGPDDGVVPQLHPPHPDQRLQQDAEALGPFGVVVAVADEHQAGAVGAVTRCGGHRRIMAAVG
jgi:hypothetical protein